MLSTIACCQGVMARLTFGAAVLVSAIDWARSCTVVKPDFVKVMSCGPTGTLSRCQAPVASVVALEEEPSTVTVTPEKSSRRLAQASNSTTVPEIGTRRGAVLSLHPEAAVAAHRAAARRIVDERERIQGRTR